MNKKAVLLKYVLPPVVILATGVVAMHAMFGAWVFYPESSKPPTGSLTPDEEKIAAALLAAPSRPPVGNDGNAATVYRHVENLIAPRVPHYSSRSRSDVIDGSSSALAAVFSEPFPLTSDGSEPADFASLYDAADLPCNFGADWTKGPFTPVQHLADARDLALWLAVQARFDMEQDRPRRALKHLAVIFGMAGHLSEEPALISQTYAAVIMTLARYSLMLAAFEMKDSPEFLSDAADLVRDHGALRTPPADVITNECSLAVSYYCRLAADPDRSADDFTDALRDFIEMAHPSLIGNTDDPIQPAPIGSTPYRHWIESILGLPPNSLNNRTFRPVARKMAVFCRMEADVLAAAADEGPSSARDAAHAFNVNLRNRYPGVPQSLFARLFLPSCADFPRLYFKNAAANTAAAQVLDALARSSRDTGPILDALGARCTVTWFDDLVYIESPSQSSVPHEFDMSYGRHITYEEFSRRLRDLASSDSTLTLPD